MLVVYTGHNLHTFEHPSFSALTLRLPEKEPEYMRSNAKVVVKSLIDQAQTGNVNVLTNSSTIIRELGNAISRGVLSMGGKSFPEDTLILDTRDIDIVAFEIQIDGILRPVDVNGYGIMPPMMADAAEKLNDETAKLGDEVEVLAAKIHEKKEEIDGLRASVGPTSTKPTLN